MEKVAIYVGGQLMGDAIKECAGSMGFYRGQREIVVAETEKALFEMGADADFDMLFIGQMEEPEMDQVIKALRKIHSSFTAVKVLLPTAE